MSSINNLRTRLEYRGGADVVDRMKKDKLRSLESAIKASYHSARVMLADGREFKCLINSDNRDRDYNDKMISIPYFCRRADIIDDRKEEIDINIGDTFAWVNTNTHWIILYQFIEETAYFKALIRECTKKVNINGEDYWVYTNDSASGSLKWNIKSSLIWNGLNYNLIIYVKRDENTAKYFERLKKIDLIDEFTNETKVWRVVSAVPAEKDALLEVTLEEYYKNDMAEFEDKEPPMEPSVNNGPYIEGPSVVTAYDSVNFAIKNTDKTGTWILLQKNNKTDLGVKSAVKLDINLNEGEFILKYIDLDGELIAEKQVSIRSL